MTWDQLMGKIREGLTESGARIRVLGELTADVYEDKGLLDREEINIAITGLVLAVSDLHSTVEHMAIGLDAVVETLKARGKSQEVKGE